MEAPMPSNKTNAKLGFRITNCFNLKLVIAIFPFRNIFDRRPYDFVDYFEPAGGSGRIGGDAARILPQASRSKLPLEANAQIAPIGKKALGSCRSSSSLFPLSFGLRNLRTTLGRQFALRKSAKEKQLEIVQGRPVTGPQEYGRACFCNGDRRDSGCIVTVKKTRWEKHSNG